jgi:hypothetical protein
MYIIAGIIHLYEDTYALFLLFSSSSSSTEIRESGAKAHSPHLFNNTRHHCAANIFKQKILKYPWKKSKMPSS